MTLADDTGEVKSWSSGRLGRFSSLDALLASRTPDPDGTPPPPGSTGPAPSEAEVAGPEDVRTEDGVGIGRLLQLQIDSIRPNEFQPRRRFEEGSLASLTDSVRELGVLQPILVRPISVENPEATAIRYELIAGERRWRAARRAGLDLIPAIVRKMADVRSLEEAIVENLHRADLNALEEATAYLQLIDEFGLSQSQVANRVGKSRSAVANTLRLLQLPGSVQRLVMEGTLSPGHARAVLSVSVGDQRTFAEQILSAELSVRQAEELAQGRVSASRGVISDGVGAVRPDDEFGRSGPAKSVGAMEVESRLEAHLDTRVVVDESRRGGRVTIDFADPEDLARIFHLLFPDPSS
jgi:ParB family chromosome partitioning protein